MSEAINDGGPAFPVVRGTAFDRDGMSLRDHFAGQALQGLCANPGGPFQANDYLVANLCYSLADAMLKAREAA